MFAMAKKVEVRWPTGIVGQVHPLQGDPIEFMNTETTPNMLAQALTQRGYSDNVNGPKLKADHQTLFMSRINSIKNLKIK